MVHITLPVLDNDGLRRVSGEVLEVEPIGGSRYRLLHSPAFIEGVASGDAIELDDRELSGFRVDARAGNLAVLLVLHSDEDAARPAVAALVAQVEALGGRCDGGPSRVRVFTVPVHASFSATEIVFNECVQAVPGAKWWYGNVYAHDGATPLGWWQEHS